MRTRRWWSPVRPGPAHHRLARRDRPHDREHPVVVVAGRPDRARPPSCPRSASSWAGGRSGTPSRGGSPRAPWPSGSPPSWAPTSATWWATRCASPRQSSIATRLKVMTDGVLLAEIARDRDLRRYDTIILDEAHERSLNIDFLLGYLTPAAPATPDLKILITSATIDTERFAAHFAGPDGHRLRSSRCRADLPGRGPLPAAAGGRRAEIDRRHRRCGRELRTVGVGDILVFLSGEREIRDAAEALHGARLRSHRGAAAVRPAVGGRAAPGLRAARRPPDRAGHQRGRDLADRAGHPVRHRPRDRADLALLGADEGAAATDRADLPGLGEPAGRPLRPGRARRVHPAVQRGGLRRPPEFTEPEILRTNLASVILQMAAAGLGAIAAFPFRRGARSLPDRRRAAAAHRAGGAGRGWQRDRPRLTAVGRRLAALPVDPRLGRMLLAAERQGCLREMLIIVSGLSIVDPRERPADARDRADASTGGSGPTIGSDRQTARWRLRPPDEPDFLRPAAPVGLPAEASARTVGQWIPAAVPDEFLHFLRVREWQDLHTQLKQIVGELGLHRNDTRRRRTAHRRARRPALPRRSSRRRASRRRGERWRSAPPTGPRSISGPAAPGSRSSPGSSLARTPPPLVVAAELVETTRLWARTVAGSPPSRWRRSASIC